ncbi:hypothetical protein M8J77_001549 [Diaphorina citri]|nr:hypothetical protein M8J77_001549 [Diaphorina citri]
MDLILHERQEGCLCAQHCLNALLQGSYFTPVDLASLGQRMDDEERMRMAECGEESDEYQKFIKQPSGNMDDSGFFSVQVISSALEVWGLELVPYSSSDPKAIQARESPEKMQAYICNFKQHWLTVRKLGNQWFNLNSLLSGPELLSNTYLGMFLAQLQNDGYSIFIVTGNLPYCEADDVLKTTIAVQLEKPRLINTSTGTSTSPRSNPSTSHSQSSRATPSNRNSVDSEEEAEIQRALNLSLGLDEFGQPLPPTPTSPGSERTLDRNAASGGSLSGAYQTQSVSDHRTLRDSHTQTQFSSHPTLVLRDSQTQTQDLRNNQSQALRDSQTQTQPSSNYDASNETQINAQSQSSPFGHQNSMSSAKQASHTPVTRIIPITLEDASSVNLSRENSMDELQNAIRLSMEPFLTEQASKPLDQQTTASSR